MTVFVVISGDNWPQPLSAGFRALGWSGCIYFIVLVALGAWVVLKLFLAILLGAIEEEHEEEAEEERVGSQESVEMLSKGGASEEDGDEGHEESDDGADNAAVTGRDVALASISAVGKMQERVLRAFGAVERRHFSTVEELQREEALRLEVESKEKNGGLINSSRFFERMRKRTRMWSVFI
jgi:hypothetical protein